MRNGGRGAGVRPGPRGSAVGVAAIRAAAIRAARRAASAPTAAACSVSSSRLPSPAMPPVTSTSSGSRATSGKKRAACGL